MKFDGNRFDPVSYDDEPHIVDNIFSSFYIRLATFVGHWPENSPVDPTDLAAAGLYSLQNGDQVKCFQCNGGICDWEDGDDPWNEHARHFPDCAYIRANCLNDVFLELDAPEK